MTYNMTYNMTYKISCNTIKNTAFSCYNFIFITVKRIKTICFDLYCKTKYFVYFIIFLNIILINYLYYKLCNSTNNNLIILLSYTINLNGCVIIKLVQWTSNQVVFLKNNNNNNNFISQLFSQYYENCYIHSFSYTKSLFYEEFGIKFDDFFELDTNYTIKSGSIAQVYKGIIKEPYNNVNNVNNVNDCVAIKVVHPEIKYQLIYPIYFLKIYYFFVSNFKCLKKYDTIYNFDTFFYNLEKQIDMTSEYANNEYFYNKYYNHNIIVIPKPFMKSKNFLIMEYIDGETIDNLNVSNYRKQIIVCMISLFIKETYLFGKYVHSDLHDGNWKILKQHSPNKDYNHNHNYNYDENVYKIIIYDFGYVIENKLHENHQKIIYYLDTNNTYEVGNMLFTNIQNLHIEYLNSQELERYREKFIYEFITYNKEKYPDIDSNYDSNYIAAYNFCHYNGYKLNNNIFDLFISTMLLHKCFTKYIFFTFNQDNNTFKKDNYFKAIYNLNLYYISICDTYDIFHDVKKYINKQYITNPFFSNIINYNNNYFDNLSNTLPNNLSNNLSITI